MRDGNRKAGGNQRPTQGRKSDVVEEVSGPRDWSWAPFAGITLVALALRMFNLGYRAMHHDESLHSQFSWYLSEGRGYRHDPLMHGPFLFESAGAAMFLFGQTDFVARLMQALFGWLKKGPKLDLQLINISISQTAVSRLEWHRQARAAAMP